MWRYIAAVRHVLTWERLSGSLLEVIIGHFVSLGLLTRELLSLLSEVYSFIRTAGRSWVPIPGAVRRELRWTVALLPLSFVENTLPVS